MKFEFPPDPEWDDAKQADEPERYYRITMHNGGSCIKRYKPSLAKVVQKRTNHRMEEIG